MKFFFPYFKRAVLSVFRSEGTSLENIKKELVWLNSEMVETNKKSNTLFNGINNKINLNFDRLLYQKKTLNINIPYIAVFGVLPPEKSGIAIYNAKTFSISDDFHVFSRFFSLNDYEIAKESVKENYNDNFFPIDFYSTAKTIFCYSKIIYVLGNSFHNVSYLDAAIKNQDKENSYLYCHEVFFHDLLRSFLDFPVYKKVLCNAYPELAHEISNYNIESIENIRNLCNGIRVILLLTGISNVIVNNNIAKEKLLDDIKGTIFENNVKANVLFLPISKEKINILKDPDLSNILGIKIGVFGICDNKYKSTDVIFNAIILLNEKYNIKSKCILAGFGVDSYVKTIINESNKNYLFWYSDITDEQIISLMDQIDIAIQLRNYPHGETSAVVCQLLGLNKNIIVSEKFIGSTLEKYCTVVKRLISTEELAETIYKMLNETPKNIDSSKLIEEMSFEKLADTVRKL